MEYERPQGRILSGRLSEPVRLLQIVSGPRQAGKTTLVRQVLRRLNKPHHYVAVDEPSSSSFLEVPPESETVASEPVRRDARWLTRQWERARALARVRGFEHARGNDDGRPPGFVLVLDEVQKLPAWSETVKGLWDADRAEGLDLHVILLGSAPLLVQQGLSESLAGRYELIRLNHWSFREMQEAFDFDLDQYLFFGGYPGAAHLIADESRWRDYIRAGLIEPNIEKDILGMTRVDKPVLLKRLFHLSCDYSGQILSYNKMVGQLQDAGNTTTLARHLDLLEGAGLVAGLPKFGRKAHRMRGSSPKLNVLNTALMGAVSDYRFEQARNDRHFWGRLAESAIGAHLYNTRPPEVRISYWRESPHEVDFILHRPGATFAIEVKTGGRKTTSRGLEAFGQRYREARLLIVGQVGGPSLGEFLSRPAAEWLD